MPAKKKILQYTLGGDFIAEWDSLAEAKRSTHINEGNISRCCQGQQFQSGGFMWAYKDSPQTINKLLECGYTQIESLPQEIWRDVCGYEGYYQVSNLGRVKSLFRTQNGSHGTNTRKEILLTPKDKGDGYLQVVLSVNDNGNNTKIFLVHRLVAKAFLPNPNNYPCVNHKDENKSNNYANNLEWCTYRYNVRYSLHKRIRK